jgi:hypothetical protein
MTEADLRREVWIEERAGMLMCTGMPQAQADAVAKNMWWQMVNNNETARQIAQDASK